MTQAFNLSQLANNLNTSGQLDATDGLAGAVPVANGGTGQSSLTANSVVLGNGTSAVQLIAPSTTGNVLTSNGTTWVSSASPNVPPNKQVFTSSGTFTVPTGVSRVKVTVIGAGGNGGNASGTSACSRAPGGGGGAGGYLIDYIDVTVGGTATVTVGTNAGTRTSSFAGISTLTAGGGNNGSNAVTDTEGNVGLSGASSIFGITNYMYGGARTTNALNTSVATIVTSGSIGTQGGGVYNHGFGVAGSLRTTSSASNAKHTPIGYGAGGGAGNNLSSATTGGIGTNGLVIVEW